ncbi:hypothetical protein K8R30_01720 [archaeon]|nr:hypothetical protein [archaeon]
MVEVKFQLVKRDFFWIGLIVVLLGVSFGYAYNSGVSPDVMGHSLEELNVTSLASVEYVELRVGNLQTDIVDLQIQLNDINGTINAPCPVRTNFPYGTWYRATSNNDLTGNCYVNLPETAPGGFVKYNAITSLSSVSGWVEFRCDAGVWVQGDSSCQYLYIGI